MARLANNYVAISIKARNVEQNIAVEELLELVDSLRAVSPREYFFSAISTQSCPRGENCRDLTEYISSHHFEDIWFEDFWTTSLEYFVDFKSGIFFFRL